MQDSKRESPRSPSEPYGSADDDGGVSARLGFEAFDPGDVRRRNRRRLTTLFVGVIALAGVITFVLHIGELSAFAQHIAQTQPEWLLLAIGAQVFAFLSQALVWWFVLRRLHQPKHLVALFFLSIGKLFADQVLPSAGVSGAFFIMHALTRRRIPDEQAFIAFVFGAASFIAAFVIAVLGSFAYVAIVDGAPQVAEIGGAAAYALLALIVILAVLAGILRNARLKRWFLRFRPFARLAALIGPAAARIGEEKALFVRSVIIQLAARAFDGVTLWFTFFAIGHPAPFEACLIGVSIASLAATIAPTPMGMGSFEAGLVASLSALGAPVETALTATLLYRGLTLWLPLTMGFFIVQRELLGKRKNAHDAAAPEQKAFADNP